MVEGFSIAMWRAVTFVAEHEPRTVLRLRVHLPWLI